MATCKIDSAASPQFSQLREYWKKHGHPSIDTDLQEAFSNIRKDVHANRQRKVPRFSEVLGGHELYKYRQRNSAAREGSSGGWRFYALYDAKTSTLYPIVIYPKKAWQDADDDTISEAVKTIVAALQRELF